MDKKALQFALRQIAPLLFLNVFAGLTVGLLINDAGYSAVWAAVSGLLIYAGSSQILIVSLISSGASLFTIAVLTFFVSARHMFYGIGFVDKFKKMGKKYPYMALAICDETYSLLCSMQYPEDIDVQKADFYIVFIYHMLWVVTCTLGALVGKLIPFDMTGMDFAATAFFTLVAVDQWKQFKSHIPAIAGMICAVACLLVIGPDHFVLPAIGICLVILITMKNRILLKMEVPDVE